MREFIDGLSLNQRGRLIVILVLSIILFVSLLVGGYRFGWTWTGFGPYVHGSPGNEVYQREKTLWDWMQLLIIPAGLFLVTLLFNEFNSRTQRAVADAEQREAALQDYLDKMSELLLDIGLRHSEENAEIRSVARTRILSVLRTLDGKRKGQVLRFLQESLVIDTPNPVVNMSGADLSSVELSGADLKGVDLRDVDLRSGNLQGAELAGANLCGANLSECNLQRSHATSVIASTANLSYARLLDADWKSAKMNRANLRGANPNGSKLSNVDLRDADLRDTKMRGGPT